MESSTPPPAATGPAITVAKGFTPEDEAALRDALKRCSASTFEAACQLRKTGHAEHLPVIIFGIIERYVESGLRPKLKNPADDLRLADDLGIDSLTMMEIVMLAEEVLKLTISNDELRGIRTLGDVRRFMEAKLSGVPVPEFTQQLAS